MVRTPSVLGNRKPRVRPRSAMVRTPSVLGNRNLAKTAAAAAPKRKAAHLESKRKAAALKRKAAAAASEEMKRMAAAASAVDVAKILRLKREAFEAMGPSFPLTAKARQAAAAAGKAKLAAVRGQAQPSGAEEEEKVVPEKKKKKVVTYLVSQSYIDHMLKEGLFYGVDEIPEDKLAEKSQLFRDAYRTKALRSEKVRACQQVLLDQYNVFGYAYDAKEVTDDEAEDDGEGEMVVKN